MGLICVSGGLQVQWGHMSMIEAERKLLAYAYMDPDNQFFALLSERSQTLAPLTLQLKTALLHFPRRQSPDPYCLCPFLSFPIFRGLCLLVPLHCSYASCTSFDPISCALCSLASTGSCIPLWPFERTKEYLTSTNVSFVDV